MLEVRRLRTFLVAAQEGTFTAAGKALYMTHSAVSQQMILLERETGLSLIQRTSKGIELTEDGRLLAERCTSLFGLLATIESEISDLRSRRLCARLGGFATASADLIPRVLQEFNRRYPDTALEYTPLHSDEMAARLRDGSIHVGVAWEHESLPRAFGPDIDSMHLLDEPLDVLMPVAHPSAGRSELDLAELSEERWVFRGHQPARMCQLAGFEPEVIFAASDYQSVHGFVGAGLGVSLVPRLSLQIRHSNVVAIPLKTPHLRRKIVMLTLNSARPNEVVQKLSEVVRSTVRLLGVEADLFGDDGEGA